MRKLICKILGHGWDVIPYDVPGKWKKQIGRWLKEPESIGDYLYSETRGWVLYEYRPAICLRCGYEHPNG